MDGILRFLYFIALIPLTSLSVHWLWDLACETAGISKKDAWERRADVRFFSHPGVQVIRWMIRISPRPHLTGMILRIYTLSVTPAILCASFALYGLSTHIFDDFLFYSAIVLPVSLAISAIAGALYRKKNSAGLLHKKDRFGEQKTFLSFWIDRIRKEEIEPYKARHKGSTSKLVIVGSVKLILAIGALFGLLWLVLSLTDQSKTPATVEQVYAVLDSQGYDSYDLTQQCRRDWNAEKVLVKAIVAENKSICFDFFVLDCDGSAENLSTQLDSVICSRRYSTPNREYKESASNYNIYTLKADGKYTVKMRVANTVVYATSEEADSDDVEELMRAIGYFDP